MRVIPCKSGVWYKHVRRLRERHKWNGDVCEYCRKTRKEVRSRWLSDSVAGRLLAMGFNIREDG